MDNHPESGPEKNELRNQTSNHPPKSQMHNFKPILIIGSFIHSLSIDRLEVIDRNGLMIINSKKRIVCLESSQQPWTQSKLVEKLKISLKDDFKAYDDHQDLKRSVTLINLRDGEFLIPGFVDTHTHAVQYQNIGTGQQYELLDWLKHVTFAEEIKFEDEIYAKRMFEKVVNRLIRVGTTTCCYYSSIHLGAAKVLAKICHQAGQRAFIGKCNMDRNNLVDQYKESSPEQSLNDSIELINFIQSACQTPSPNSSACEVEESSKNQYSATSVPHRNCNRNRSDTTSSQNHPNWRRSMIQAILTPRFALSCTEQLLRGLGDLMKTDNELVLQTHLSESLSEISLTKEFFPDCSSYSDVYDSFGLLGPRTILAHCIHLESSELALLLQRNCGLSHCPTSNFNLSSGICQVQNLLKSGFGKIGLGTDVSGGYGVGILTTIRDAASAAKTLGFGKQEENQSSGYKNQLSIENLFYMATLGGAKVCNLDDRTGNFELGKEFDGLLIQTGAGCKMSPSNMQLDEENDSFKAWILESRSTPYPDGSNPNFFVDDHSDRVDLIKIFEKFLFTGDDRNIGTIFINSRVVGGCRPLK